MMTSSSERRAKPRFTCNYPAVVAGFDTRGKKYEEVAKLANLSADGLYMLLDRFIEPGSKLIVTVFLSDDGINEKTHKLETKAVVVRTEPKTEKTCGVAVRFTWYRFY